MDLSKAVILLTNYNPGDYFCVDITSHSWGAKLADWAIKYFTNSQFCHSALVTSANGDIIEARPHGGVTRGHISEYAGMTKIFSNTILTTGQRAGIVNFAGNLVGKDSYNFGGVVELGLYTKGIQWNWLEEHVASDSAEDKMTFCSQLVAMAGRANGVTEWMCGLPYATLVTPANLAELAMV